MRILILLVLMGISANEANEIVYTLSGYGQLVTSSTLRWETTNSLDPFARVDRSVIRAKDDQGSAICRGYYQNTLVPGGTNARNQCAAYFFEKLVTLDDFQVLVDKALSSRYEWEKWDIFTKLPIGGVAFTEGVAEASYVAKLEGGKVCELNPRRGLSGNLAVSQDGKSVAFLEKGYILKEIEPQSYQLKNTKYATWRAKVERTPVYLGSVLLANKGQNVNKWEELSSVVTFNASYSFYFGQLDGLIRALPAQAKTYGGGERYEEIDFSWGLPLKFSRRRIQRVSATLMSGTVANVSVEALLTTTELPYESTLVSTFKDGQVREHNISGTYQETVLANILVKKGAPYFITNGTEAPTTTTTTTTTSSTTTISEVTTTASDKEWFTEPAVTLRPKRTTTPMPTEENPLLRFYPVEEVAEESNEIPQMMSDEGAKHSERSSPMTDFFSESASGQGPLFFSGHLFLAVFILFTLLRQ